MKPIGSILIIIFFIIVGKFWIGIYNHDEFNSSHIFIKHRAIWKTYFYSPRGMSDLELREMSPSQQFEQEMFDEFILSQYKL
ncbi:hypothetical protein [Olleya namhaensis]|uniref:hypothetical protein n=1 Tax=Olleya namhaensis TaxID=1144750 RepID=UPI00232EF6B3|nr:hypothetical protein [Olleya namhaensis]